MTPLKITDARAGELSEMARISQQERITQRTVFRGAPAEIACIAAARDALPDLLADRRVLLDALSRAVSALGTASDPTVAEAEEIDNAAADLRALLASSRTAKP